MELRPLNCMSLSQLLALGYHIAAALHCLNAKTLRSIRARSIDHLGAWDLSAPCRDHAPRFLFGYAAKGLP